MENKKNDFFKFVKKHYVFILLILIAIAIGTITYASYAFFTGQTEVKNTFEMGKVVIDLDEPNWSDEDNEQSFIPGTTYLKDPTTTAVEGDSYMRMILEIKDSNGNPITDEKRLQLIKDSIYYDTSYDANNTTSTTKNLIEGSSYSIATINSMLNEEKIFKLFDAETFNFDPQRSTNNRMVYYISDIIHASSHDKFVLFTNIVVPTDYTNDDIALLGDFKVELSSEAIQSDGFSNCFDAFNMLDTKGIQ